MAEVFDLPALLGASIHRWLETWNVPELAARTRIELSSRLTRSLARCYPERRLIRIASHLAHVGNGLLHEVLCHELAHLAARELHGPRIRPHGAEWQALVRAAGYEPRTRLAAPPGTPAPRTRRRFLYLHRCPVCQAVRAARRPVPRWRCAACVSSGLEGRLTITRQKP